MAMTWPSFYKNLSQFAGQLPFRGEDRNLQYGFALASAMLHLIDIYGDSEEGNRMKKMLGLYLKHCGIEICNTINVDAP